jgi:protein tyrosine phosphatase (PTP) superfamily phosphohydrolase (DUF442 family)
MNARIWRLLLVGLAIPISTPIYSATPSAKTEVLTQTGDKPQDYPGLHNVMRVSDRIISGSEPDPEKGLETLKQLGVKTVVSVDGAKPAVDRARELGMRYVHIPIGYGGVDEAAGLTFARLVREATGPFYIHCHHGKHRGPAAAAVAYIAEVSCEGKDALFVLERAGTSPDYPGLWRDVENYTSPAPGVELPALVEVAQVDSMVAAMANVDRHYDNLKLLHTAKWELLADHPDLVPIQEALLVREGLHEAGRQLEADGASVELKKWMAESEEAAQRTEDALKEGDKSVASEHFEHLVQSCKQCHAKYRD